MFRRFPILMALMLTMAAPAAVEFRSDPIPEASVPETLFSAAAVFPSTGSDGPEQGVDYA